MRRALLLLLVTAGFARAGDEAALAHALQVGEQLLVAGDNIEGGEIYSGKSGVALFLVDLHKATKQKRFLDAALALLAKAEKDPELNSGLHTGWAGIGQVYLNAGRLKQAEACAKRLKPPQATDVIYGAAGTGIFLLNLHSHTGKQRWLDEADKLGRMLAKHAVRKEGQTHWPVTATSDRVYIGFSHGAAGIGYYLLHLHLATKKKLYRTLAEEAARFVRACAVADGDDGWKWTKMQPPRKQAWPVQWCHGSPGIGLFLLDMHKHLGGEQYKQGLARCIASNLREGRTARIGGCQCHGSGGNAELLVEVYRHTKNAALLNAARDWSKDLAGPEGVHTRVQRWDYDPGYMLGMAGIGRFFLRLSDPEGVELALMVNPPRSPSRGR